MGWEERRGHSYYYRSVRVGTRVRKEYVGGGDLGQLVARLDELERLQRKEEEAFCKGERERLQRSAAFLQELEEAGEVLTRAHLLASGCHQHKGQWRRKRGA
jgi:hypothetical protein